MPWRLMRECWYSSTIVIGVQHGDKLSASRSGRFSPGTSSPRIIGYENMWVSRPVWILWKRQNSCPWRESNLDRPAYSTKLYRFNHPDGYVLLCIWITSSCVCHFVSCVLHEQPRPRLWSSDQSSWLQIRRSRFRFQALTDFLKSSESRTESTQPRECNRGATWKKITAPD
jgi:hypothetical protein